ncbi:MAG: PKD domain-containing protein [Methanoregula sp.]
MSAPVTTTATTAITTTTTTTVTPLVASFTPLSASGTAPLTIQFEDTSTGSPTTWDWNFGDEDSSSSQNPSYTYNTAGTYTVSLTIGDGGVLPGNTSTQTATITVTAAATTTPAAPAVTSISPTYGPLSTGTTITITGTNFTGATGVTFGGTAANSFSVVSSTEITATSPASVTPGQVDVLVTTPEGISTAVPGDKYNFAATATTIPVPIFSASPTSGTAPLEVTFTDESTGNPASWSWNFGDGNTSTLENPTNTYAVNGTYTVSLTEVNSINSNETTMTGYIVVGATTPVAAFSASPLSGIAPLTVQFIDQSTGSPTQWEWSFGDGSTGSAESPSHVYTNPGTYTATLVSINSEGSSTNGPTQTITVNSGAAAATPVPTFTTAPTFAINTESTTSGVNSWLAQQQAIATAVPTHKSPGYDAFAALIGCGVIAGIALYRKK